MAPGGSVCGADPAGFSVGVAVAALGGTAGTSTAAATDGAGRQGCSVGHHHTIAPSATTSVAAATTANRKARGSRRRGTLVRAATSASTWPTAGYARSRISGGGGASSAVAFPGSSTAASLATAGSPAGPGGPST